AAQPLEVGDLRVEAGELRGHVLSAGLVLPQVRLGRLLLQLGPFGAEPVEIEDLLDPPQHRVEAAQLLGVLGHVHVKPQYATARHTARSRRGARGRGRLRTHPWAAAAHGSASAGAPTRVRPGTLRRRSGAAPPATTGGGAGRSLDRNRL